MYQDLGRDHFNRRFKDQQKNSLLKRLADPWLHRGDQAGRGHRINTSSRGRGTAAVARAG